MLHAMYLALDYPLYEGVLRMHGVNELADALRFSTYFYAEMVGMHYGVAYIFCKWVLEDRRKLYHTQSIYTHNDKILSITSVPFSFPQDFSFASPDSGKIILPRDSLELL